MPSEATDAQIMERDSQAGLHAAKTGTQLQAHMLMIANKPVS